MKRTIVSIAQQEVWERARESGTYTQSTIDSSLAEVGFLHCSFPDQTIGIANRHFAARQDLGQLALLLIDADKVKPPVKYEGALSGRAGIFPHIYGPLNVDAVYAAVPLERDGTGSFATPEELLEAQNQLSAEGRA